MSFDVAGAYAQIKALEDSGQIALPETLDTIVVGTIDPVAGTFTWSIPTLVQTISVAPPPQTGVAVAEAIGQLREGDGADLPGELGPRPIIGTGPGPNEITNITVGLVATTAVDLRLRFAVIPERILEQSSTAGDPLTTHPVHRFGQSSAPSAAANVEPLGHVVATDLGGGQVFQGSNGGVTITGFSTISSSAEEITLDAGLVCSVVIEDQDMSPPLLRFLMTVNFPEHPALDVQVFIVRPPVVGMGVFSLPALPMTIVYAPPQGKLLKNNAKYADTTTLTRTVTTSISTSTSTKSVQAYSAADLLLKVGSAVAAVAAIVGTGGTAAGAATGILGALRVLMGSTGSSSSSTTDDSTIVEIASATEATSKALQSIGTILAGFDSPPPSDGQTVAIGQDQTLTLTQSAMSQFGSDTGYGPGVGDRIVYLTNVKVVWMAVNGEVGIVVLGFDGVGANAAKDLLAEAAALESGAPARLDLDLATIKELLSHDPLVARSGVEFVESHLGPALIGPPRFVPASPPFHQGSGTDSTGDVTQVTFDSGSELKETTTTTQTTIVDLKPGWIPVLFGADDNVETTTTTSFVTSQTIDDKTDDKLVGTVTFFSVDQNDAYDVQFFTDLTFMTYVILDTGSPLTQGSAILAGGGVVGTI